MNKYYQMPLLPGVALTEREQEDKTLLTSEQRDAETTFGFTYTWLGWWGALLLGSFDGNVVPKGYHLRSITLCRVGVRWGVFLNANNNDGHSIKLAYTDLTRQKALRGIRYLTRRGAAEWRDC